MKNRLQWTPYIPPINNHNLWLLVAFTFMAKWINSSFMPHCLFLLLRKSLNIDVFLIQLLIIKFHSARNYIKVSFRSLLFKIIRLIFYVRHFFYWRIVFSSEVLVIVTILLHEDLCDVSDLKCKPNITQMNQCS